MMKKIMIGMTAAALVASAVALRAQTPEASAPAAQAPEGQTSEAQAPAARNVWDGVFTADQAAQGKAAYNDKCSLCHGADLNGAEMAPPLSGAMFLSNWSGQAVADLFARIHFTMPANDPGSMSNAETASILAYILSFNQFPAGTTPLPSDETALAAIAITAEKPAGK